MKLRLLSGVAMLFGMLATSVGITAQSPTAGEEIDMGVSVMWRGYNLGAETPSKEGTRYAFGSIVPGNMSMENYPFYDAATGTVTLPENISGNPDYDAATATTNGKWRIPTREEWEELFANCTITGYFKGGYLLTSEKTGNVLLLPASGMGMPVDLYTASSDGSKPYVASINYRGSSVALQSESSKPWNTLCIRAVCDPYSGPALEQIVPTIERTEIFVGTTATITATSVPEDVPMKLTYNSSNTDVATVSDEGVVRGISEGTATITVASGDVSATLVVTVIAAVETPDNEEYVDLGLSVDWCSHNFGAQTPYETGTLYPFAYITATTLEDAFSYKFYKNLKYVFPKADMSGDPAYDAIAAAAGEGSLERLPSEAELTELVENCDATYYEASGDIAEHIKITSKINGKSIKLPLYSNYVYYYSGSANTELNKAVVLKFVKAESKLKVDYSDSPYDSAPLRGVREHKEQIDLESIKLDKTEATIYAENTVKLTATPQPVGAEFTDLKWTSADEKIAIVDNEGVVTGVAAGEVLITATDGEVSASATITVKEVSITDGETVDMGLSVLWASCELGASSPSIPGDLYSWGATTRNTGGSEATWNEPDLVEISGTEYDAALMNLGNDWRMPTRSEITELVLSVSHEWITYHGQYGVLLTSNKNGAQLFCPLSENLNYIAYFGDKIQPRDMASDKKPRVESVYIIGKRLDLAAEYPWQLLPMRPVKSLIPPLESLVLNQTEIDLSVGETAQLTVSPMPEDALVEAPVWTSENDQVATVSNDGLVTAVAVGETNVTVTVGNISASAKVNVKDLSGIENITAPGSDCEIYTVDGNRVGRISAPGVYIIRRADGSVTKRLVR